MVITGGSFNDFTRGRPSKGAIVHIFMQCDFNKMQSVKPVCLKMDQGFLTFSALARRVSW